MQKVLHFSMCKHSILDFAMKQLTFCIHNTFAGRQRTMGTYRPFNVALKPFELLSCKFVTFPIYEWNTSSQNFSAIEYCLIYFEGTFWHQLNLPTWPFRSNRKSEVTGITYNPINDNTEFYFCSSFRFSNTVLFPDYRFDNYVQLHFEPKLFSALFFVCLHT